MQNAKWNEFKCTNMFKIDFCLVHKAPEVKSLFSHIYFIKRISNWVVSDASVLSSHAIEKSYSIPLALNCLLIFDEYPPTHTHPDINGYLFIHFVYFQVHHLLQNLIWICNIFRLGAKCYIRKHGHSTF